MRSTEQDRKAFYQDKANKEHNQKVAKWLKENPQIGVLSTGKYYKIVEGEQVWIEELAYIDPFDALLDRIINRKA